MIPLQDGGRDLTCPCCQIDLQLPDRWYLTHEHERFHCDRCSRETPEAGVLCDECVKVDAYHQTYEYGEIMARRRALQRGDVLAAVDAEVGSTSKAARRLGVLVKGPREETSGQWLYKWIKSRDILPAFYEIKRKHGWRGDPPIKRPRKHPDPVLVFSRQAVSE